MRIVSGIQPTGELHLGNYLGAIKSWVKLQNEASCYFFIADLHALTVYDKNSDYLKNSRKIVATLLACGLDPKKVVLFKQSSVREHAEMAWLLNCVARVGWLNRMTQFKTKGENGEGESVGLYAYPVLQTADILLYQATHVPVGADQKQHIELTRDIAEKFNRDYGKVFEIPKPLINENGSRVMSLTDGLVKMSKSDVSEYSRINLTDDADTIALKIKKAKTDAHLLPDNVEDLKSRPEAHNLMNIYSALTNKPLEKITEEWAGKGFGELKKSLTEVLVNELEPIGARVNQDLGKILDDGAKKAREEAEKTLYRAKLHMGI